MEETPQINARDVLLRDTFTPAEMMLYGAMIVVAFLTFWLGDPRSFWLLGGLLIFGCVTPVILETHIHTHPFFVDLVWPKFWLCTAPAWLLILQFGIGFIQDPIETVTVSEQPYYTLESINIWLPTMAADISVSLTLLGFCAVYILSASLFIIPKSRSFFQRLFPLLCMGAVLVGVFGYIQKGLELKKALLTKGTGAPDFFAFFPYDGHWAAFATLWCAACIAMALLTTRYEENPSFIESTGPWYLTGGVILGASGFLVRSPLPAAVLLLTLSTMLLLVAANFITASKDTHRTPIAVCCVLVAFACLSGGLLNIFKEDAFTSQTSALRSAAYEMFQASPIFGWGIDSFEKLLPFYSDDSLLGLKAERATSDYLQILAEFGAFGLIVMIAALLAFIIRYVRTRAKVQLTNHLLIGCGAICLLAFFDTPFMSPAVFFSFFAIFFSSMRWADLSRQNVDEVDAARPQLITHEKHRRVPFFNKNYKETFK